MKIPKIYIDTSVIGGCFDEEFQLWSNSLVADLHKGFFQPVVSTIVTAEIKKAPELVQLKYEENKSKSRAELIQYYASLKKETLVLREENEKYGSDTPQKPKP